MKTKILSILALLLMTVTQGAWAQSTWTAGGCTVNLNGTTMTVSKSDNGNGAMPTYGNSTQRPWNNNSSSVTTLIVKEGVTKIGYLSFYNFTSLASVSLPSTLTSIEGKAFQSCSNAGFTTLTIPAGVTSIGSDAFWGCTSIANVYCYANPANLTWDDALTDDFIRSTSKATKCHVPAEYLSSYTSKFGSVNVTFKGDAPALPFSGGSGTEASPYLIASTTDWNNLVSAVNGGETYSGKYFQMTANVGTVSTWMTGTFSGTFDGDGKTLTVGYSTSARYCAPFGTLGGTVKNLRVAGTVSTSDKNFGGIAAQVTSGKTATIQNCRVSTSFTSTLSGDNSSSSFVGVVWSGGTLNITGCAFTGSLTGSGNAFGGILGYKEGTCSMTDCLFAPASVTVSTEYAGTFSRPSAPTITNCYFTRTFGTAQGLQARTIAAGDYVSSLSVTKGDATATYDVSGITVYSGGIDFNDGSTTTFYGGSGQTVSLALTPETRTGYQFKQYAASQGSLSGETTDTPTLTMPAANSTANDAVTISAEYDPTYNADFASSNDNNGWTISPMQQIEGGTVTVSYTGENKVKSVTVTNKYAIAHSLAASVVGDIVGTDGNAYAVAEKDKLPVGVTAAGVVTYKSGENGIVVALQNLATKYSWSDAFTAAAAYTPAVSGQTWKLGTKDEMSNAILNDYAIKYGYITAAGGTFPYPNNYWSATEVEGYTTERAWRIWVESNGVPTWHDWDGVTKATECQVRPIIAF